MSVRLVSSAWQDSRGRAPVPERSNRRASNTDHVRRAPWAAQQACSARADDFQNRPRGSSAPISVREEGGDWRMVMGTGPYRSVCVVSDDGRVRSIDPY